MCGGVIDARGLLTGGGGLSGIDVADNDHVDVHLFLTRKERIVSNLFVQISAIAKCNVLTDVEEKQLKIGI